MNVSPDGRKVRAVCRGRMVPREDGAHERPIAGAATLLRRVDLPRDGVFQALGALGPFRDILNWEALHPEVLPDRTVIVGDVKAHVFSAAARTDRAAVAGWLIDEHDSLQQVELRLEPDAADLLVSRIAYDIQHWLELAVFDVPEVIRIPQDQRSELRTLL